MAVLALVLAATVAFAASRAVVVRMSTTISRKDVTDIRLLEEACRDYAADHGGESPPELAELLRPGPRGRPYLHGTTIPCDPWGRPYLDQQPCSADEAPLVRTLGRDGEPGGDGDDADVGGGMLASERRRDAPSPSDRGTMRP